MLLLADSWSVVVGGNFWRRRASGTHPLHRPELQHSCVKPTALHHTNVCRPHAQSAERIALIPRWRPQDASLHIEEGRGTL